MSDRLSVREPGLAGSPNSLVGEDWSPRRDGRERASQAGQCRDDDERGEGVRVERHHALGRGQQWEHHGWLARAVSERRGLNGQMRVLVEGGEQKSGELNRNDKET